MKINWNYPTSVWVGEDRIKDLSQACKNLKISSPLLVTDKDLINLDMVKNVILEIKKNFSNLSIFSNFSGNPSGDNVNDGVKIFNENKISFVESPVMGGPLQAKEGILGAIVGADNENFTNASLYLQSFCKTIFHFGEVGKGSKAKLISNFLALGLRQPVPKARSLIFIPGCACLRLNSALMTMIKYF